MIRQLFLGVVLLLWFVCGVAAKLTPLQTKLQADLKAINQFLLTQTPAAVDPRNVVFKHWLEDGLQQALEKIPEVKNYDDYYLLLRFYVNGFHDPHVVLNLNGSKINSKLKRYWPGFLLYSQDKQFYVSAYAYPTQWTTPLPPIGATLVSCDGVVPQKMMKDNVFPYYGNPEVAADWVRYAPLLLLKSDTVWFTSPKQCVFRFNNKRYDLLLSWRDIPKDIELQEISYSYRAKFMREVLAGDVLWISLPTFNAKTAQVTRKLKQLVQLAPKWRNKKVIIFDLRGNTGGNSAWGTALLSQLYGIPFYRWAQSRNPNIAYAEWRASKDNVLYLHKHNIPYIEKSIGSSNGQYHYMKMVASAMLKGMEDNQDLVSVTKSRAVSRKNLLSKQPTDPVKARLVVVTDGRCASACLTFLDKCMNMPNTLLLGKPTYVDTNYTEIRYESLPGSNIHLGFPMKVWRGRKRLPNQAYQPKIVYSGDINNTKQLQAWTLQQISK